MERLGQVFLLKGKQQIPVTEAGPGELAAWQAGRDHHWRHAV